MKNRNRKLVLACALALAGAMPMLATSGNLNISTDPLGTGASSIKPNVMFILDDSGSMAWDYMPDYVNDRHNPPSTTAACYDSGDDTGGGETGGSIGGNPDACIFGDPPYNSPDLNTIYYNPDLRYRPALEHDGFEMQSQNAAATSNWTAVRTDPYLNSNTTNLVTAYPDRVWCSTQADAPNSGTCRQNSGYNYPNQAFPYGNYNNGDPKYLNGSPYYYRMQTRQFCTSAARTTCVSGNDVNPNVHIYPAAEFCKDQELTDCAAGAAVTSAHIYSGVRWCNNTNLKDDPIVSGQTRVNYCQRKKIGNFIYAKHVGVVKSGVTIPARSSEGNIQPSSLVAGGATITDIRIGTTLVTSGPIAVPGGTSFVTIAAMITNAINNGPAGPAGSNTFVAVQDGNNVTVSTVGTGPGGNGQAIAVNSSYTGTASATGTITINTVVLNDDITGVSVNGQAVRTCAPGANTNFNVGGTGANGATARWETGTGRIFISYRGTGSSAPNNARTAMRNALRTALTTCAVTPPGGSGPFTYTDNGSYALNVRAPLNLGATPNGWAIAETGIASTTTTSLSGGASTVHFVANTSPMAGGADAVTNSRLRVGTGQFTRTNIVPAVDSYPRAAGRSDCLGVTCTYQEEMTNFGNWYAYHRTRLQLMKAAAGRAFANLGSGYRVGFITICPVDTSSNNACDSDPSRNALDRDIDFTRYLRIADFDASHRKDWYEKLYGTTENASTPLREALSRVGLIYAGKFDDRLTKKLDKDVDDPITASCQPNFAILSTDGYWNGTVGRQTDSSTAIGNQDNQNVAPYSLRQDGVFDGNLAASSDTLADVALYYYKNDLRPTLANSVPTTDKDKAAHQHMVTFTLGLGLDGQLTFRQDYETAGSGDFYDIKQGPANWPAPVAGTPTTLDDLWHAAVNGRGVFFSAKNPDQVAESLSETLEQLQARVGAGAAAATSNLQPVAGDNFAYTAQYQTVDWIGDLKARTIDLASGTVSGIELWSAATLLDARLHIDRTVFTYDGADTTGNRMKHFCMPADVGASWCNDGSGLTPAEVNYFDPGIITLAQEPLWTTAATAHMLVNYLRGDKTNYNLGTIPRGATDLFRERTSLLGDIVNAQPAYVRKSPFAYGDNGYFAFKACTEGTGTGCPAARFPDPSKPRRGTVFAAANDGMLHAFETDVNNDPYFQTAGIVTATTSDDTFTGNNAGNGAERWAYIPGLVLPRIHALASEPYAHQYFVDGSPTVGDICLSTPCAGIDDWRTILVAGLNAGGRGYFALDITNPTAAATKVLWEFGYTASCVTTGAQGVPVGGPFYGDCHVGLSYGNPIITKLNGKWVVMVTSGYNNGSVHGNGNGGGYLYVLDAATGQILHRLATGAGTAASPSGLARINGWTTNSQLDNTTLAVYGGDLDGNLWRFDTDYASGTNTNYLTVTLVAVAKDALGNRQPITVRPELGETIAAPKQRLVMFATGKFLETVDKSGPFTTQTIYTLRDDLNVSTGPVIADVRGTSVVERQFQTGSLPSTRTIAAGTAPVWTTDFGWRIDLPDSGERANVDPQLQLGTLVVATNVPSLDTCTAGGISYLNFLDFQTGSYVPGATGNMASQQIGSSLTVGINVIMLPGGKVITIATTAANQQLSQDTPISQVEFQAKRVSWRELIVE